jgi:hypothetical protein
MVWFRNLHSHKEYPITITITRSRYEIIIQRMIIRYWHSNYLGPIKTRIGKLEISVNTISETAMQLRIILNQIFVITTLDSNNL